MKLFNLLLTFTIALICLFFLQALWLYYTYRLHLESIEETINSIFHEAVEKELDQRFLEMQKKVTEDMSSVNFRIASFKINCKGMENHSVTSQQSAMVQQLMATYHIHFSIDKVDSIFHSLLQSNQYPFSYQIHYEDSLERAGGNERQSIGKGFKTDVLPIINGENVFAIVKITAPAVFKNMLAIFLVSVLIFFFICACLIYGAKMFINQHQLNRLRKNFTHALTHDMKTPIATIHSVLIQFEEGTINKDPELRQKFSSIAIEQAINLQTTVNQILTLAHIEKKQLSLNKQAVDLQEIIQSLIDKFTVKSHKSIEFQTSCDLKNTTVYADSFHLNNAISNLIDNAVKYSGNSVKIEIECEVKEKLINIRVRDNGFGISLNDQLKIFKQFERGAEIKRNQISGFGIGLNYVQQIIEAHKGTVTVLSQEGVGSEFIITIPVY